MIKTSLHKVEGHCYIVLCTNDIHFSSEIENLGNKAKKISFVKRKILQIFSHVTPMFIHCKMKSNSLTLILLTTCALKMLFAVLWFSLMTRDHNDKLYTLQPVESVQLAYRKKNFFGGEICTNIAPGQRDLNDPLAPE